MMIRLLLSKSIVVALLAMVLPVSTGAEMPFMGLRLGMTAKEALALTGRSADLLMHVRAHSGMRIITDTVPITFCRLPMRRSLGFDSLGNLSAVGITYKTSGAEIKKARDCMFQWLTSMFGTTDEELLRDSVKQEIWHLGTTKLTMEAKAYNESDYFVLVYYYRSEPEAVAKDERSVGSRE